MGKQGGLVWYRGIQYNVENKEEWAQSQSPGNRAKNEL